MEGHFFFCPSGRDSPFLAKRLLCLAASKVARKSEISAMKTTPKWLRLVLIACQLICVTAQHLKYGAALSARRDQGYSKDQRRLLRFLTNSTDNDHRARPALRAGEPINVTIRMNLYQIIDVEERNQYAVIYVWMTQMWRDTTRAWDPRKYSNISMVVLPFTEIWLPDTYLYNNMDMVREQSERWINVIVEMYPNDPEAALVTFRYPALYRFTCNLNVKYFPFDKQTCTMIFGSWTYDATGIDFFPEKEYVAKEDFSESEEWQLISFKAYRSLEKYACCPEPFSLLRQHLVMRRKPLHYIVNLIIPTCIISVVSTVGFFTPSTTTGERTEKINLGISTLLAFAILLLMVADQMPTTSKSVPLIGWFLLGIMVQTGTGTLASVIILAVHNLGQNGRRVPPCIRRLFFTILAPLFCVSPPPSLAKKTFDARMRECSLCKEDCHCEHNETKESLLEAATGEIHLSPVRMATERDRHPRGRMSLSNPRRYSVHDTDDDCILKMRNTDEIRNEQDLACAECEWLATVLDRVTLTVSLVAVCVLTVGVLAVGYAESAED